MRKITGGIETIMKYALIGCGRISKNHIKAALANGFDIVAVCDILPERMEELLKFYELDTDKNIGRFTDYSEMIEKNPDIELISIATDSDKHAEIALCVIRHNINVIIEKPMAMSLDDADLIIKESELHNVKVSVCHQNRFNIAIQQVRRMLEKGKFGKLSHGSICVRWNRNKDYYDQADWRGKWKSDGGALMNQCIHGIDLLRWMMGDEIEEVYGVTKQQFHNYLECEDLGLAVVKFKNGAVATIEGTVNVYPKNLEETLYLFGENGTVKVGGKSTNTIDVFDFKDSDKDGVEGFVEQTENVYGNGHTSLFFDVAQAIEDNRPPYVTAYDGKRAVELVLAIYESSYAGKPVKFPIQNNIATIDFINIFDKSLK